MIPETKINKGDVLISKPSILGDITFNRSLILIADFNEEGYVGFIINRPLRDNLSDLVPTVNKEFPVFDGGPVDRDKLYFVHNVPELISGGFKISENLYWGGHQDELIPLLNNNSINQHQIKFFLGYSGWAQSQLEEEIKDEAWLVESVFESEKVITCSSTNLWNQKMKSLGGEYLIWSNAPDNPNYN
jgi:putative transcriptional regulator